MNWGHQTGTCLLYKGRRREDGIEDGCGSLAQLGALGVMRWVFCPETKAGTPICECTFYQNPRSAQASSVGRPHQDLHSSLAG